MAQPNQRRILPRHVFEKYFNFDVRIWNPELTNLISGTFIYHLEMLESFIP